MVILPQNNFGGISDGTVGIAFRNDSLTEYEVLGNKKRIVALSLLQVVLNLICTEIWAGSHFPSKKRGQYENHQ